MRLRTAIADALPELRREAEAMMTDTALIRRPTGEFTTNPFTLEEEPVFADVVTVRCKIKHVVNATELLPGQSTAQASLELHVPFATTGIRVGDQVTVTAVDPATGDPDVVGERFRIVGPFWRSYATARRYPIEGWS